MKRADGSAEHGFTLVELLIALSIFAMLAAAGVMLLSGSVRAQGQIAAKLDDLASVQRASALLTADLAQAVPRISRTEIGTLAPAFFARSGGGAPALQFVRTGRGNADGAARSALQKLEYALVDGRLERRAYPLVDGSAAGAPSTVIEGVTAMQLRFRGEDGGWRGDWQVTDPTLLPRAVEMTLARGHQGAVRLVFLVGADPLPPRSADG